MPAAFGAIVASVPAAPGVIMQVPTAPVTSMPDRGPVSGRGPALFQSK